MFIHVKVLSFWQPKVTTPVVVATRSGFVMAICAVYGLLMYLAEGKVKSLNILQSFQRFAKSSVESTAPPSTASRKSCRQCL